MANSSNAPISKGIYNLPKYDRLAELAISDAHHDKLIKINDTYKRLIISGFPNQKIGLKDNVSRLEILDENDLFNQLYQMMRL